MWRDGFRQGSFRRGFVPHWGHIKVNGARCQEDSHRGEFRPPILWQLHINPLGEPLKKRLSQSGRSAQEMGRSVLMYSKDAAVLLSHSDPAVLAAAAVTEARVDGEALADLYLPTSTSKSNSVIFCPRNACQFITKFL